MEFEKNYVHLTDYSFQKLCDVEFGINRGVYNEIDKYFYHIGIINILERRKQILRFIQFHATAEKKRVRFGNGGLRQRLIEYMDKVAI